MSDLNKWLRRYFAATAATAVSLMAAVPLHAQAVTLSLDFDPGTTGIQSTLPVMPDSDFVIDVVIADVVNLHTFNFDLDFDPTVLSAISVVGSNFLPRPFGVPPVGTENDVSGVDVNFGEFALSPFGATGGGVLASITFKAISAGINTLELNDVELFMPNGVLITDQLTLGNGTVTVSAAPTQVPAPASGALIALGLLGSLLLRRRRATAQG